MKNALCLVVLGCLIGFGVGQFSMGGVDQMLDSPEAKAVMCLIPPEFVDFFMNLTIRDIVELAKISPQLQSMSNNMKNMSTEQIDSFIKTNAPDFYEKIQVLSEQYQTQYESMPADAKTFLMNLASDLEKMKDDDTIEGNFDLQHQFLQDLNQNYTGLDNSSRSAIVNFFPTLAPILGSTEFTSFLNAAATAQNTPEMDQAGRDFVAYVVQHACDNKNVDQANEVITRAKRYIMYLRK